MNVKWQNNKHLFETATTAEGGKGGGGGTLFTPSSGGSGTPPGNGNANSSSGAVPPGDNGKTGNTGTDPGASGGGASDWKSLLPKELQEDANVRKFNDVSALAGAYINLQKQLGRDKIVVPGPHTTDEQWQEIFEKLGKPKELEKYEVKFKEGLSLDDNFAKTFKETLHKAGVLPKQAQQIADWFSQVNETSEAQIAQERENGFKQTVTNLKKEWGSAFEQKVQRTNHMLKELGGDELMAHFNNLGLGGDEKTFKFLAGIADKLYAEHKLVGENNGLGARTPAEVKAEITKIMGDKTHPYFVKDHPAHKQAVQEMLELQKELAAPKG